MGWGFAAAFSLFGVSIGVLQSYRLLTVVSFKDFVMVKCEKSLYVVFAILFVFAGVAFAADAYEPDNIPADAKTITIDGQAQTRSIDPAGDEDWLSFTIASPSVVVIETSGSGNDFDDDTVIWLYDDLDQVIEIASDDDSGQDLFSKIEISLLAGTYYLRIHEYNDKRILNEYFVSVDAAALAVTSIDPDNAPQLGSVTVTIIGDGATFFDGSSTVDGVWLTNGPSTINAISYDGTDASSLTADFDIPADAQLGDWDVHVSDTVEGELAPLTAGFSVYAYPDIVADSTIDANDLALLALYWLGTETIADLNGDGIVNNKDFSIVSMHWLEGKIILPVGPAGLQMILVTGGDFQMGNSNPGAPAGELPVHTVTLDDFHISKYETTNGQYAEYLNEAITAGDIKVDSDVVYAADDVNNIEPYYNTYPTADRSMIEYTGGTFAVITKGSSGGDISMSNFPVNETSWYGAKAFCDHYGYLLPTEAQWEYAARGGNTAPEYDYPWDSDTASQSLGNFYASGFANPQELTSFAYVSSVGFYGIFGAYGLCDMGGNVSEWCSDWYNFPYSAGPDTNPTGPASGSERVIRGGGWNLPDADCSVFARGKNAPDGQLHNRGFRACYYIPAEE